MRSDVTIHFATDFGTQLQGAENGRKAYAHAWSSLSDVAQGASVLLDFKGVDVATGSWINAMLVPLFRRATDPDVDLFPVLCGVSNACADDLRLLAKWTHQCYLVAASCKRPLRSADLIGELDPGQRDTLDVVMKANSVTGAELERQNPQANIGATAWNNRLKDLHQKRLLRRTKRGREQVYSPVVEVITFNG